MKKKNVEESKSRKLMNSIIREFEGVDNTAKNIIGVGKFVTTVVGTAGLTVMLMNAPSDMKQKIHKENIPIEAKIWENAAKLKSDESIKRMLNRNHTSFNALLGLASNPNASNSSLQIVYEMSLEKLVHIKGGKFLLDKIENTLANNPSIKPGGELDVMLSMNKDKIMKDYNDLKNEKKVEKADRGHLFPSKEEKVLEGFPPLKARPMAPMDNQDKEKEEIQPLVSIIKEEENHSSISSSERGIR